MIYILLIVSLVIGFRGLLLPAGYLHAPTLMGLVFGLWYAPQLILVAGDPLVPRDAIFDLAFMSTLCVILAAAGWHLALRKQKIAGAAYRAAPPPRFSSISLLPAVIFLTALSFSANVLLEQMRPQYAGISQWSGPIVIVSFFAQLRIPAMVASLLLAFRDRNAITIILAAVNVVICVPVAFVLLRRSEMIDVFVAFAAVLWFAKRIRVPLPAVLSGMVLFGIIVFSIAPLRQAQHKIEYETGQTVSIINPQLWQRVSISDTLRDNAERAFDVRNATYMVQYVNDTGDYSYGGGIWNRMVNQYVPGQLVGRELKRDLMAGTGRINAEYLANQYSFFFQTGTTPTGPGAAYRDFWYFGAFFFFLIAYILGALYYRAMQHGFFWQIAYTSLLPFSLTAITHGHERLFVNLPIYTLAIWLSYLLAKWTRSRMQRDALGSQTAANRRARNRQLQSSETSS